MNEARTYSVVIQEAEYPYDVTDGLFQLTPDHVLQLEANLRELQLLDIVAEYYVSAETVRPKEALDGILQELRRAMDITPM